MSDRSFESIKYPFNPLEIKNLGEALARETQSVLELEARKKTVDAELNGQIKAALEHCADLARKINIGWELRDVEVMAMMETPRPGMKRIIRVDNNEHLRDEAMTRDEMQASFGFSEPDEGEK